MTSSKLVRWGAVGFLLAGVLGVINGIFLAAVGPEVAVANTIVFVLSRLVSLGGVVVWYLPLAGVVGLHALQRRRYGGIGRVGFYTTLVAAVVFTLGSVVALFSENPSLAWVSAVGVLGTIFGFMLLGFATVQARVLPRWYGVLLIIALPVAFFIPAVFFATMPVDHIFLGGEYEFTWRGFVWLALGYVLWSQGDTSVERTAQRLG